MSVATPSAPTNALYVGDLSPEISDTQLFNVFSEFKTLTTVRVCRDSNTGRSLCYGYVNFISAQDAVRAIEARNHSKLNGKPMRVMWSNRDSEARRSGVGNVFVKNLADSIDSAKLEEVFKAYGNIMSCKIASFEDGKSKGYGFVQFYSEQSANSAIQKLNGFSVEGKELYVAKFVKKGDRVQAIPKAVNTNLYMKNLDPDVTEENLNDKFSEFGKILSLVISKDDNGASKGFGFVNFENPEDARCALEAMNGSKLGTKVLYVSKAQKKEERAEFLRRQFEERRKERMLKYQGSNVYVKNIDDSVTEEELRERFSSCGTIVSAKLMKDDKGINRGFGFVCFSSPEEATTAVNTSHGMMFHGKPLYVAIAQRKDERQAQLNIQYAQIVGYAGSSGVIPGGYQPVYYTVVSPLSAQHGMMYQPMGMRPGWRSNDFTNRVAFQQSPVSWVPYAPRHHRQNRGRHGGHMVPLNGGLPFSHLSYTPQRGRFIHNAQGRGMNRAASAAIALTTGTAAQLVPASSVTAATPVQEGSQMLSSMLAAVPPENRKQILAGRLYPLVDQQQPELAPKITDILLEMDNAELLLLLESPESLAAKIDEAVEALKVPKPKVSSSSQEALQPSILCSGVAVN